MYDETLRVLKEQFNDAQTHIQKLVGDMCELETTSKQSMDKLNAELRSRQDECAQRLREAQLHADATLNAHNKEKIERIEELQHELELKAQRLADQSEQADKVRADVTRLTKACGEHEATIASLRSQLTRYEQDADNHLAHVTAKLANNEDYLFQLENEVLK